MANPTIKFKRGTQSAFASVGLQTGEPAFITDELNFYIGIDGNSANNKFFGSHRYWSKESASKGSGINLVEATGGSDYITLAAPASVGAALTYYFPATQGAVSSVLTNDGSGNLTWASGSANPVFTGIATFTDTTDNTLGNYDTGAVQIDGGLGVAKNVTVGAGLSVEGQSYFIGTATFYGGQINLGDSDGDNISVAGEFVSNLVPNATNTYDLGLTGKRWRDGFYSGSVDIAGNLVVDGNVTVGGGNTVILYGQDVFIKNKDIILGYTTSITNEDASTDITANHAGVAIASTEGSPLVPFSATGINTLPDTYKQLMWFKSGTLGFGTDAFAFNYGVAIGTTTMADGVRLAVGTGVTVSDTSVSATTFYGSLVGDVTGNVSSADQVKTVSAADNPANYYITFVDANNGSATNESVYTDDGIYYNPGTNTFTTQNGYFTGNVTVDGTITGTATTATRATLIDTTGTSDNATYYATFVDTSAGQNSETLRTGTALSLNASTGNVKSSGDLQAGSGYFGSANGTRGLYVYDTSGDVSFQGKAIVNQIRSTTDSNTLITLSGLDATFAQNVNVTGITTTGTLKLNGTSGIGITGISASTTLAEDSDDYLPTQKAVKAYVDAVDVTLGLNADTGGPSTVSTSQTLTINGTASEVNTSVSGQTITVGLPDAVVVGTSLSAPTVRANIIESSNTGATVLTLTADDAQVAGDLTVGGNLYVNGNTTQVNTTTLTVEDNLIELAKVDGSAPGSDVNKDVGMLLHYYDDAARLGAVFWDDSTSRIVLASRVGESSGVLTVDSGYYAPVEIGALWVTDCAGTSQVISCTGAERFLENITVDGGQF